MSLQSLQSVRILGTTEMKHVPIHTDQGRIPIVYWSDIKRQFPHASLAIFAGTGLDFVRNKNNQLLVPMRIKAQHPSEIVVQLDDSDGRHVVRAMEKHHVENIAEHKKGQTMIDNVLLLKVKAGIRALFDLPNHSIPRMFIIVPEPTSKRNIVNNIANIVSRSYRLFFLCECGDSVAGAASTIDGGVSHKMHFAHHEGYEIRTPKAFIQKYGRHMIKVLDAIQTLATIGGAFSPAILNASKLPANIQKVLKSTDDNCLPRIKYIADHLEKVLSLTDATIDSSHCQVLDSPDLRAVGSFLVKKDDNCLPRIKYIADHLEKVLSLTDDTIDSSHCQVLDGPGLRAVESFLVKKDDNCLPRMKYIAEHLEKVLGLTDDTIDSSHCQVLDSPDLRALESFLVKKDDNSTFGNLHRILTSDNKIKWVCDQHVEENAKFSNLGELDHTIRTFGGTLDKKRGLVTVRLTSANAEEFFWLIGKDSLIQELDITLDFGPSTSQIRTLRKQIKFSQVSSLSINIDIPEGKYIYMGMMRAVGGGAQLLKLVSREKVVKPGPFRSLSIKGVSDILEGFAFEGTDRCLAYSLALDRVCFKWEREMSKQSLLMLLDKAPDLSMLRLCSSTLEQGYAMVRKLAQRSHRLTTIHITTDLQEQVEFVLKEGSIETIMAAVRALELGTVAAWGDKIKQLTVMDFDCDSFWPVLKTVISKSPSLTRLDIHCPVNGFCSMFQQIKDIVGPESNLEILCLRHGESELFTKDIRNPVATTMIKMLPEEEGDLGMWSAYSLFGFFPACDASPCQLSDEQVIILRDHFQNANIPMRLKELNLDVSNLTRLGLLRLSDFFDQYKDIRVRVSGSWARDIHNILLSNLGARLTGFDMTVHLSGTSPLASGATSLFKVYHLMQRTVSIPKASLSFMTKSGNAIVIKDLRDPKSASFDIIYNDEPIDIALIRYFGCLPSELFDHDELFDINPPIAEF